jgi:hypothetical protein
MHTDVYVSVFEFNCRSIRPHFELAQLFGGHAPQCTDPLSWNQEASIVVRDDLDGIPLGDVANSLRPNFDLCFGSAGGKCRGDLGITNPFYDRRQCERYLVSDYFPASAVCSPRCSMKGSKSLSL